jgi:osmotically-inducible protein OsmY
MTLCLLLSAMLCGCAAYRECGFRGCPGDATITANVKAQFARYPPLTAANSVRIQTLNKVVYLTGQVDTDVERLLAVSLASDVEGVTKVVDSISVDNVGR